MVHSPQPSALSLAPYTFPYRIITHGLHPISHSTLFHLYSSCCQPKCKTPDNPNLNLRRITITTTTDDGDGDGDDYEDQIDGSDEKPLPFKFIPLYMDGARQDSIPSLLIAGDKLGCNQSFDLPSFSEYPNRK